MNIGAIMGGAGIKFTMYPMYQAQFLVAYFFSLIFINTSEEVVPQFHIRKYKCEIVVVAHLCTGQAEAKGSLYKFEVILGYMRSSGQSRLHDETLCQDNTKGKKKTEALNS